jgi:hypothetical protein
LGYISPGPGNDLANPAEGAASATFRRDALASDYADDVSAPAGPTRPSARAISNAVHAQSASVANARGASDYLWMWGQFLNHDLSLTRAHDPAEPLPIPVAANDPFDPQWRGTVTLPFNRSKYDPASSPREQVNELSAWLDASMVYGADPARAAALRRNDGSGKLRTSAGELLPFNTDMLDNRPTKYDPSFFLAGDIRANESVSLLALHTVFVREHNRLAARLKARFPAATEEELYQGARRIVTAELQATQAEKLLTVGRTAQSVSDRIAQGNDAQSGDQDFQQAQATQIAALRYGATNTIEGAREGAESGAIVQEAGVGAAMAGMPMGRWGDDFGEVVNSSRGGLYLKEQGPFMSTGFVDADGILSMNMKTKLPSGERGWMSGVSEFSNILRYMDEVGVEVQQIKGVWKEGYGLTDNLDEFNRLTASGVSPEIAALRTWTGQQCTKHGFGAVQGFARLEGSRGAYTHVEPLFGRR